MVLDDRVEDFQLQRWLHCCTNGHSDREYHKIAILQSYEYWNCELEIDLKSEDVIYLIANRNILGVYNIKTYQKLCTFFHTEQIFWMYLLCTVTVYTCTNVN